MSLQVTPGASSEEMGASEDSVISATSLLSSTQEAHVETISSELKLSFDAITEIIKSASQSNVAQSRLLEDAIQKTQKAIELSSNRIQNTAKCEGQANRADLDRLDQGLEQTQRAIAELSESSLAGMQLATRDIKQALTSTTASMTMSHSILIQNMAQDLETKITRSFSSTLENYGRMLRQPRGRTIENEDDDTWPATGERHYHPCGAASAVTTRNGPQVTEAFYGECLAQMWVPSESPIHQFHY